MRKRINYLDVIRIFACFCVTTVHYNASVSGYDIYGTFYYPNSLIPNEWFGVYLGTLGVGLFFLISGAALEYNNPEKVSWLEFYKKRFWSIYPGFWIAFIAALCVWFWKIGYFPLVPVWHLIVSALGFDGYAMSMGFPGSGFYQVGEWFLGCIILIYLLYPLFSWLLHRWPVPFVISYCLVWCVCTAAQVNMNWFFLWGFYVVLGMAFVRFVKLNRKTMWAAAFGLLGLRLILEIPAVSTKAPYELRILLTCAVFFLMLYAVSTAFDRYLDRISSGLKIVSALTYPVFLVHHKLIYYMAYHFDLEHFSRKSYLFLYIQYLALSFFLGWILLNAAKKIRARFQKRQP